MVETILPGMGRLAGIDYGAVRVGVAICDPSQRWVTPLATYQRRGPEHDSRYFQELATTERIVGWVVGLPIHCSGRESEKSKEARTFATWLSDATSLPHALFDERFTSAEARRLLEASQRSGRKKKEAIDRIAAHLILSHFLDSSARSHATPGSLDDG